jgi:hypothetical protein
MRLPEGLGIGKLRWMAFWGIQWWGGGSWVGVLFGIMGVVMDTYALVGFLYEYDEGCSKIGRRGIGSRL